MKKTISVILAAALLLSMSITAFAADNEQKITVSVPNREYTMTIPATTEIQYGSLGVRDFNDELTLTSKDAPLLFSNNHYVQVELTYNDLTHTRDNQYTLPLEVYYAKPADETNISGGYGEDYTWESLASGESVIFGANGDFYWENGYKLGAKVTEWDNAEPGEYQATVTYVATLKQR